MLNIFIYLFAICIYSLKKCLLRYSLPILNWFLCCWVVWALYLIWILIPWIYDLQISSPIQETAFSFLWCFLGYTEVFFLVWYSPTCLFLLLFPLPLKSNSQKYLSDSSQCGHHLDFPLRTLWFQDLHSSL